MEQYLEPIMNWANKNSGLVALIVLLITLFFGVVDLIWKWKKGKNEEHHSQRKQLEKNEKWRKEFSDYLQKNLAENLNLDHAIFIRDFGRIKQYPKAKTDKVISPSFKVWFADTYYNGIMVSLGMLEITYIKAIEDETNWFYCDIKEPHNKKVFLLGKIPYERIEVVNWQGDEWNDYYPQVFCRFDSKSKEPYDELVYCERIERQDLHPYYKEVVKLQDMRNKRVC